MSTESTYLNSSAAPDAGNISLMNDSLIGFEEKMSDDGVVKLIFQVLLAFLGATGRNTVVTIVITKLARRKKPGDSYIQNLAISDLGAVLLAFPIAIIKERAPLNWPFGEFSCNYLSPVPETFYGASLGCIAVIAVEQYRIMFTLKTTGVNKPNISLNRAMAVAAALWLTSFSIFSFPLYFIVKYIWNSGSNSEKWCGAVWPLWDHKLV